MKYQTLLAITLTLLVGTFGQTYQLVWSDEFDGTTLDLTKWQYEVNCDGGGNAELQCYTSNTQNVAVVNGSLKITAVPQSYNGQSYTSGRINTAASAAWKYGRFDVRAKIPNGIYLWPALWMMPRDSVYGGWAASGEIDIMENMGGQNSNDQSTLHFGGAWPNNSYQGSGSTTLSFDMTADYHIYSLIWTSTEMQFLIDGTAYYTISLQRSFWNNIGTNPYTTTGQPFDQYFYFIMNVAVDGGFFGGNAAALTSAQAAAWSSPSMFVDYIRVYQLSDTVVASPIAAPVQYTSSTTSAATPSTTSSATCQSMFSQLKCRTTSEDPTQLDATAVSSARTWLCNSYPSYCTAIATGGLYSSCNTAEQLSYAMTQYYAVYGASQGSGACSFGGLGVVSTTSSTTKATTSTTKATTSTTKAATSTTKAVTSTTKAATTAASTACQTMFSQLKCRTTSEDSTAVSTASVASARSWLCTGYPSMCTAISTGGTYSTCNSVEQISYAMNQYYAVYGAAQGTGACSFGGIGVVVA